MNHIYKIFLPGQWADFLRSGLFSGAPIDVADGYIHLSSRDQSLETAQKHFSDHDAIVLARINSDELSNDLRAALKWEVSRGGAKFPHLYAPLPLGAIDAYWSVEKGGQGFVFPDDF